MKPLLSPACWFCYFIYLILFKNVSYFCAHSFAFQIMAASLRLVYQVPCKSMLKVDKSNLSCPLIRDVSSLPPTIAVCSCGRGEIMGVGTGSREKLKMCWLMQSCHLSMAQPGWASGWMGNWRISSSLAQCIYFTWITQLFILCF